MIRKNIKRTITEYFFINPEAKLRVREIERTLSIPLPSVIRYCKELQSENLLKTVKIGKVVFYTADRTSEEYILEKKLFNLRQVYISGLIRHIKENLNNPVIILFGSYARGEDTESSDIDLYIETPSKKNINLEKFEKLLKRKIQVFRHESIKKISNPHLANNIINGVILNNHIGVFR